jgi:nucleoside-diphosphate-sugar epimerase
MHYFVTGATGFIGKRLVKKLLARKGATVSFLIRPGSEGKVPQLREYWEWAPRGPCRGRGPHPQEARCLRGGREEAEGAGRPPVPPGRRLRPVADEESQVEVNVAGTQHAVEFARAIDAGHFHHVSSIAAAGLYEGVFREDMFAEAENFEHPYFLTKHESEKIVREECKGPGRCTAPRWWWATARPGRWTRSTGPTTSSS